MSSIRIVEKHIRSAITIVHKEVKVCHSLLTADFFKPCLHQCIYCYGSFIAYAMPPPGVYELYVNRPKLIKRFMEKHSTLKYPIRIGALSNVSHPKAMDLLAETLEYAAEVEYPIVLFTKALVHKHPRLEHAMRVLADKGLFDIEVTITTMKPELAKKLEPKAPPPSERVKILEWAKDHGIPFQLRVSPVFQGLTDSEEHFRDVLESTPKSHVIVEYVRAKGRVKEYLESLGVSPWETFPDWGRYSLAPISYRREGYLRLRSVAHKLGWSFAVCGDKHFKISDKPDCCCVGFYVKFMHMYKTSPEYSKAINNFIELVLPATPLYRWKGPDHNLAAP